MDCQAAGVLGCLDEHADEREAIRREALTEYRARYGPNFPSTTFGHWAMGLRTNERFTTLVAMKYRVSTP